MKAIRLVLLVCLTGGLACNTISGALATPQSGPRSEDIQTAIAQTQQAGGGAPAPTPPPISVSPPVPTAPPAGPTAPGPGAGQPEEAILILKPGPQSEVVSPVHVAGTADPTFEQTLAVQIIGEDGSKLASATATIGADAGQRGPFAVDVPFTTASNQHGRIVVSAQSPRDGGTVHLASVEVVLLASGTASIQPGKLHPETLGIREPAVNATLSGGMAHVSGISGPTPEQTLVVEVTDADGNTVGSGTATISAATGQPGIFDADVAYTVPDERPGRVVVYATSPRDGGILHLSSVEVTLKP
ncbi:MAG: hypothetical protein HY023_10015 [Chloroflexi bacterium]|nr:hypothetical protein [Chloroflexota bacterium]